MPASHPVAPPTVTSALEMQLLLGGGTRERSENKMHELTHVVDHLFDMMQFATSSRVLFSAHHTPAPAWLMALLRDLRDVAGGLRRSYLHRGRNPECKPVAEARLRWTKRLAKRIDALKPQERLLLPIGPVNAGRITPNPVMKKLRYRPQVRDMGRLSLWEIVRQNNGRFSLRVYGASHPVTGVEPTYGRDDGKLMQAPAVKLVDISPDAWGTRDAPGFALLAMGECWFTVVSHASRTTAAGVFAKELYNTLLPALERGYGARRSTDVVAMRAPVTTRDPWQLLLTVVRQHVPERTYKRLKLEMYRGHLVAACNMLKRLDHQAAKDLVPHIDTALRNARGALVKALDAGHVDSREAAAWSAWLGAAEPQARIMPPPDAVVAGPGPSADIRIERVYDRLEDDGPVQFSKPLPVLPLRPGARGVELLAQVKALRDYVIDVPVDGMADYYSVQIERAVARWCDAGAPPTEFLDVEGDWATPLLELAEKYFYLTYTKDADVAPRLMSVLLLLGTWAERFVWRDLPLRRPLRLATDEFVKSLNGLDTGVFAEAENARFFGMVNRWGGAASRAPGATPFSTLGGILDEGLFEDLIALGCVRSDILNDIPWSQRGRRRGASPAERALFEHLEGDAVWTAKGAPVARLFKHMYLCKIADRLLQEGRVYELLLGVNQPPRFSYHHGKLHLGKVRAGSSKTTVATLAKAANPKRSRTPRDNTVLLEPACQKCEEAAARALLERHVRLEPSWTLAHYTAHLAELRHPSERRAMSEALLRRNWSHFAVDGAGEGLQDHVGSVFARACKDDPEMVDQLNVFFDRATQFFFVLHDAHTLVELCDMQQQLRGLCIAEAVRPAPTDPGPTLERVLLELQPQAAVRDRVNALWMHALSQLATPSADTLLRCLLTGLACGNARGARLAGHLPRLAQLAQNPDFLTLLVDGISAFLQDHNLPKAQVPWACDFSHLRAGQLSFAFTTAQLYLDGRRLGRIPTPENTYFERDRSAPAAPGFALQGGELMTSTDGNLRIGKNGHIAARRIRVDGRHVWLSKQGSSPYRLDWVNDIVSARWAGKDDQGVYCVADDDGQLLYKITLHEGEPSIECQEPGRRGWRVYDATRAPAWLRARCAPKTSLQIRVDTRNTVREVRLGGTKQELRSTDGKTFWWTEDPDYLVQAEAPPCLLPGVHAIMLRNTQGMRRAILTRGQTLVVEIEGDDTLVPRSASAAGSLKDALMAAGQPRAAYEVLRRSQFLPGTDSYWFDYYQTDESAFDSPEVTAVRALDECIHKDAAKWDSAHRGAAGLGWVHYHAMRSNIPAAMRMPVAQERRWLGGPQGPWGLAQARRQGLTPQIWSGNDAPHALQHLVKAHNPEGWEGTVRLACKTALMRRMRTLHGWERQVHLPRLGAALEFTFLEDLATLCAEPVRPAAVREVQRRLYLAQQERTYYRDSGTLLREVLRQVMQNPALRPLARTVLRNPGDANQDAFVNALAPLPGFRPYYDARRPAAIGEALPYARRVLPAPYAGAPRLTETWSRPPLSPACLLQTRDIIYPPLAPLGGRATCAVTAEVIAEFDAHTALQEQATTARWQPEVRLDSLAVQLQQGIQGDGAGRLRALIEKKASRVHGGNAAAQRTAWVQLGPEAPDVSYARLVQSYARGELETTLAQSNPTLDAQAIADIVSHMRESLLEASQVQQARRVWALLQRVFAAQAEGDANGEALHLQAAADMLASRRCYDVVTYPHLLVFEVGADILLRKNQVEALHTLLDGGNAVLQLPMGSGKTKVLLPLLAFGHHLRNRLPVVLVPPALLPTCLDDLTTACGILEQRVQRFDFSRHTPRDAATMAALLRFLEDAHARGTCILSTKEAFQALQLCYYEALQADAEPDVVAPMGRALALLGAQAVAIVDEADTALDVRKELVFARGSNTPLADHVLDTLTKLYGYLCADGDPLALQSNAQSGKREDQVKTAIDAAVTRITRELDGFEQHLSPDEQHEMLRYMTEPPMRRPAVLARLYGNVTTRALARELAVLREEATHLLPMTLRRNGAEHYGLTRQTPLSVAIPYNKGKAQTGSLFGNDYEAVNFTIQAYLHRQPGIGTHALFEVAMGLRRQVTQALERSCLDPEKTGGAARWRALCGDLHELSTVSNLFAIQSEHDPKLATLRDYLHQDPTRVLAFVRRYVLEGVTQTSTRMAQNAHDLCDMFGKVTGFTGTPWNRRAYPKKLGTTVSRETDQVTKRLLLDASRTHLVQVSSTDPSQLLTAVAGQRPLAKMRALIDCGALLRGRDSGDVAAALQGFFKQRPEAGVKAVMYFDSRCDALMLLPLNKTRSQALNGSDRATLARAGYRSEDVFAYYDQAHAIGADLPLTPDAIGAVTLGEVTALRDLQQGALRLRELTRGQRCDVVYPASLARNITQTKKTPDMQDVLRFVAANQGEFLAADKVQSVIQRMRRELLNEVDRICAERPAEGRGTFFACVAPLVMQLTQSDPYELFGDTQRVRTDLVLRHAIHSLGMTLDSCIAALRDANATAARALQRMRDKLSAPNKLQAHMADMGALPTHQTRRSVEGSTVGQQVQRELSLARQQVCEETPAITSIEASAPPLPFVVETLASLNLPVTWDSNLGVTRDFMQTRAGTPHDLLTCFQKPITYVWVRAAAQGPKFVALSFEEAEAIIARRSESPLREAKEPMALCNHHGQVISQSATPLPPMFGETPEAVRAFALLKGLQQVRSRSLPLSNTERELLAAWRDESPEEADARALFLQGLRL